MAAIHAYDVRAHCCPSVLYTCRGTAVKLFICASVFSAILLKYGVEVVITTPTTIAGAMMQGLLFAVAVAGGVFWVTDGTAICASSACRNDVCGTARDNLNCISEDTQSMDNTESVDAACQV